VSLKKEKRAIYKPMYSNDFIVSIDDYKES
jgi:hypothetical protein